MQTLKNIFSKPFVKRKTNDSPPKKYFSLNIKLLRSSGCYPLDSSHRVLFRVLYWFIFFLSYIIIFTINTITKVMALPHEKDLDDLTDNIGYLISHALAMFKTALFVGKRNEINRLIKDIEGTEFLHNECECECFSPNDLIHAAIRSSRILLYIFSSFAFLTVANGVLSAAFERSEGSWESEGNYTNMGHRALPYHAWFPFTTDVSPNYELTFIYQVVAILITSMFVISLDTLIVGFMLHIKVQFQILGHNLKNERLHAAMENQRTSSSSSEPEDDRINRLVDANLKNNISHHQAIIRFSHQVESVFNFLILSQFVCSLLTLCVVLWQVSSASPFSARFAAMFFYFSTVTFQLFMYCWFGNEIMLESLTVNRAAWESEWVDSSRGCRKGIALMMHRSQRAVMLTAGGFAPLNLETFTTILRGSYSYYAVLKKMDGGV